MIIGLIIYGSLDTISGGYLYDRRLVEYFQAEGDTVEIISLPWRTYAAHLTDNFRFRLPRGLDLLIQDELNHPSLLSANARSHPYPVISLVHHLRCSEKRPKWQNDFYRKVEKRYLNSVDGFIFNSQTTRNVVNELLDHGKPSIVAYPPTDRFGGAITESEIMERGKRDDFRILFLGNVIERKGLHTLLNAISDKHLTVKVDVVGSTTSEPKYANEIQKIIVADNLSSSVFLHGSLDSEPLKQKLKQAHVLVVPSTYEGFGIVYLEGMGFGLPAIGTSLGAASEIITDGIDGFIVEAGNAALLADRLTLLKEKREVLVRMSLAARERYQRQPKWGQTEGEIRQFLLSFVDQ